MAEPRCCLAHSLFNVGMRSPERVAVIHARNGGLDAAAGDVSYTYGELWNSVHELVQQLEGELAKLDANGTVFPGSLLESSVRMIGILITQSAEYLVALMAVSKIRAVFVPLDPSWPLARIVAIANDSKISLIIGCSQSNWAPQGYVHDLDEVCKATHCPLIHMAECRKGAFRHREEMCWSCCELPFSYMMYTSGSTGKPKGVCGTERGLLNRLEWMERAYPYVPSDLACFKTAISFIDHLTESLGALLAGTVLIIPFREDIKNNSLALLFYMEAYKITRLTAVPSLLHALLPAMRTPSGASAVRTLRVVVSSGESLSSLLLVELQHFMPNTTILNLYGSTEVSGDCTYFDCNLLPKHYEHRYVPIGKPIPGCYVGILSDNGSLSSVEEVGELYVGGIGLAQGYWNEATATSQKFVNLPDANTCQGELGSKVFKTGDVARRLENGSIILLGRNDRSLKIHGQRIQPQEIESILKEHLEVADAAVSSLSCSNNDTQLVAYVVPKSRDEEKTDDNILRNWLKARLPLYMVPGRFINMKAMPLTDSGKVDYSALEDFKACEFPRNQEVEIKDMEAVERIVQVFSQVLLIEKITPFDDFFLLGGTSVSAAHVAHILGIDMRLLLNHRSALTLHDAIKSLEFQTNGKRSEAIYLQASEDAEKSQGFLSTRNEPQQNTGEPCNCYMRKRQKMLINDTADASSHQSSWPYGSFNNRPSAFIRSNRFLLFDGGAECLPQVVSTCPFDSTKWSIQKVWQHCLHACVDASPLLLITKSHYRVFVGSHAHKFVCLDAISGKMEWETTLGGRVESTAAIAHNFSQIVVGCYDGRIYFLDTAAGSILWSFQTGGEVKCQPTTDTWRGLIWCGSHDHSIYALDPVSHACIWKNSCDGSIFASPSYDAVHKRVYIATTNGRLICICTAPSYGIAWEHASGAPIFGSPNVDPSTGNVVFATVDGFVTALSSTGSIAWKVKTEGPVFAGLCISAAINYQVLLCSRDGHVYSYCQITGRLLWKTSIGEPIVAGAWVDETIQLLNRDEASIYRLVCVCGTSGTVCILRVRADVSDENSGKADVVAKLKLPGDLFSSPLMFGGRIFVGCRDNNVYCLDLLQNNQQVLSACNQNL